MRHSVPFIVIAAVAFAGLQSSACNKEKGADCQRLVQTAGPAHSALKEAFGRSDQLPPDLEAQAESWEKTAAELKALALKDSSIQTLANEYAAVIERAAKIRRDMAAAGTALDPTAAAKSQAAATSFITDEMKAMSHIQTTCN